MTMGSRDHCRPISRTLAVLTGSRAEYGLLRPLMAMIRADADVRLQTIVTGMHLQARFGNTVQAIEGDGFAIDARVAMPVADDSPLGVVSSMGRGIVGIAEALARLKPDLLILLGDRYEVLCAAQAALLLNIPLAHIHGGEASQGTMDESIRHAITKLSHLHFTAAQAYRWRVIQMGEHPSRVWNVGAIGLDSLRTLPLLSREALQHDLAFDLGEHYFLITYHPVTLDPQRATTAIEALLSALDHFPGHRLLFTGVNADPGYQTIDQRIREYCRRQPHRVHHVQSLGQLRYLSAMTWCDAVVGNSSSGIIEAPALKRPTVNVGQRQLGRLRTPGIIDCDESVGAIRDALQRVIAPHFQDMVRHLSHPYGDGHAAEAIFSVVSTYPLSDLLLKKFYDLPENATTTL